MNAKLGLGWMLIASAVSLSGCQSWSGGTFPLQSQTRVPPPGTGTYQLPNGYYNNTSAPAPTGQAMQTGSTSGQGLPNGVLPTTNLVAGPTTGASNFASSAQFTAPAPSNSGFTTTPAAANVSPASFQASGAPTAIDFGVTTQRTPTASGPIQASLSDSQFSEAPSLQWQQ